MPTGAIVVASPWLTQRDDRWWPQPLAFRLARFAADAPKPAAMTDFPFAAGPRTCIAMGFARLEMALALAAIRKPVRLTPAGATSPRPRAEVTLCPQPPCASRRRRGRDIHSRPPAVRASNHLGVPRAPSCRRPRSRRPRPRRGNDGPRPAPRRP
ncbi:MAG: cytochrome P450 [Alphaproteobacteria bacterium]